MTKKSGLMIDTSRKLNEDQRKRIMRTLRLSAGIDPGIVLNEIEFATQNYWSTAKEDSKMQRPAEIARELSGVAKCATKLLAALDSLGEDAEEKLEQLLMFKHIRGTPYVSFANLDPTIRRLLAAAQSFQPKGRPREDAMGVYVIMLASIHEDATGVWPKCIYDPYTTQDHDRIDFFVACMNAAGVPYQSGIINRVLKSGKRLRQKPMDNNAPAT